MAIGETLGDVQDVFPLTFDVPESFQEVNLHADAADRAEELYDKFQELHSGLTEEQLLTLLLTNQQLVEQMIEQDIVYAATFLGRSENDTTALTAAQFTVTWQRGNFRSDVQLDELANTLVKHRAGCEVQQVGLPVGAALAIIEEDNVNLRKDSFGTDTEEVRRVRQLQVLIPLTSRRELVCFGISTECIRDWEDYVEMMAGICKTVRRTDTQQRSHIKKVLDG